MVQAQGKQSPRLSPSLGTAGLTPFDTPDIAYLS